MCALLLKVAIYNTRFAISFLYHTSLASHYLLCSFSLSQYDALAGFYITKHSETGNRNERRAMRDFAHASTMPTTNEEGWVGKSQEYTLC